MSAEIVIVLLLIVLNGVFSMSELAVVSARRARLQLRAEAGDRGAQAALELAESPDRFLSTIQVGITLVGILAGAFGGSTISRGLAAALADIPALEPYSDAIGVGVVVVAITYLSLVLGELVPKRIALTNPEGIASAVARPMMLLARLAGPIVALLTGSTSLVVRLLRVRPPEEPPVTEEEITAMLAQGAEAGVFEEMEQDIVENVFRLGEQRAADLMTPRYAMAAIDIDEPVAESLRRMAATDHFYFPVYQGDLDHVLGVVSIRDLWLRALDGKPPDLRAALFQPLFVPESLRAARLLELFQQTGQQIALVVNEYGSVEGLITLSDVLRAIVGDAVLADARDSGAVQREDGTWLLDGTLPLDEFRERIGETPLIELAEQHGYQTVAGMVLTQLGRIPAEGDHFERDGLRFEVVDMDGQRIDKVLVCRLPAETEAGTEAVG